jgi:hypothetical protein
MIEEYLGFTGPHIKKLRLSSSKVDPQILQKLLNLIPNLKCFELFWCKSDYQIKWDIKSTKIELITIRDIAGLESLFGSLENCAIQEVKLLYWPENESEIL